MWKNTARAEIERAQQLLAVDSVVLGGLFLLWTALGREEQPSEAADTVWVHLDTADCAWGWSEDPMKKNIHFHQ